jgi:hypothetical protein
MSVYSTRTYTWQDLADESVASIYTDADYTAAGYTSSTQAIGWQEWIEWTGNGTTIDGSTGYDDLVYTSPVKDLGVSRTFYPTASVRSNGTSVTINVQASADGSTGWSTQTLGAITGRYIRFQVTVVNASETARLDEFEGEFFFDTIQETFDNFSVGAVATTLPIARSYSAILGIIATAPHNREIVLTDATASAPKVIGYDLDTWGKVASATTADIVVQGFPNISADSNGNIVVS